MLPLFNVYKQLTLRVAIRAPDEQAAIDKMLNLTDTFFEVRDCDHYALLTGASEEPSDATEASVREHEERAAASVAPSLPSTASNGLAAATEMSGPWLAMLLDLASEAEKVLAEVGGSKHLPPSWRWPLIDELNGAISMVKDSEKAKQSLVPVAEPEKLVVVNPAMKDAFIGVLRYVVDQEYPELDPHSTGGEPDDLKAALANAIESTAALLNMEAPEDHPNPAEHDGPFYDWAAEAGFGYGREEDQD